MKKQKSKNEEKQKEEEKKLEIKKETKVEEKKTAKIEVKKNFSKEDLEKINLSRWSNSLSKKEKPSLEKIEINSTGSLEKVVEKVPIKEDEKKEDFKYSLGRGYDQIGVEYLIPTNSISKQIYSSIANSGENNNKAKLTKNDVILIRERFDSGETYSEIHKDYSFVKLITIKRVCNRETWKNI